MANVCVWGGGEERGRSGGGTLSHYRIFFFVTLAYSGIQDRFKDFSFFLINFVLNLLVVAHDSQ